MVDPLIDSATASTTATDITPSPSSPAPASSTTDRPVDVAGETAAVFKEMAAAGTAPPAVPRETTPPAKAATQPDASADPPAPDGRLPLARHQAILKEAREKADREVADIKQRFAWAEKVTPQQVERGVALINWLTEDPVGAIDFLQRQHAKTQPPAKEPEPIPEPDVVLGDGSKFYSAEAAQKYADYRERQFEQRITGQIAPVLQTLVLSHLQGQANAEAATALGQYRKTLPQFQELEKDIKALCLQHPGLSIELAHKVVHAEHQLTRMRDPGTAQPGQVTDSAGRLQQKAAASTVAPGMARPLTPKADAEKTSREITREVFAAMR